MSHNYNRDLYKILEIDYNAETAEIKAAYRRLVRLYHPDVAGKNSDEEKFKEIQEAYEVLSNSDKRQKYDIVHGFYKEKLKKNFEKNKEENKKNYSEFIKQTKTKINNEIKQEKKESFSQSINEALDSLFHTQNKRNEKSQTKSSPLPADGEDIRTDVSISPIEAIEGAIRKVNILHTESCPTCSGRRFLNGEQCSVCNGTGQIQSQKKITVKIPKGVKQGSKVRIRKEGNKGQNGGENGDLYLIINIKKDKYTDTDGTDILINLPVTPFEAALGADIPLEILNKKITVKLPPLTSSGQKLRISRLDEDNKNKARKGDIIITVIIKMPVKLSEEEKLLYEKLKNCSKFDIRKDFKNAE